MICSLDMVLQRSGHFKKGSGRNALIRPEYENLFPLSRADANAKQEELRLMVGCVITLVVASVVL